MIVGITYDLREEFIQQGYSEEETAEFDRADTIKTIERTLRDLGFNTDRIGHIKNLTTRLVAGERWDLVFNIAEGLRGVGRESQVPALLDAYAVPYTFSDPLILALTLHKALAKRVVRDMGIPTPDFVVVETDSDIEKVDLSFPLFAKPVAEGTGKGITTASKIQTRDELLSICQKLLVKYEQPVLIETFLPGREFTVGIVGTGEDAAAIGVMEILLKNHAEPVAYSYTNKEECESLVEYRLADNAMAKNARQVALAAWRGLGCRDAGRVDLRADAQGVPHFMEVNPLAGLHPHHSDLPILCTLAGVSYRELIGMIMTSALKRLNYVHGPLQRTHLSAMQ